MAEITTATGKHVVHTPSMSFYKRLLARNIGDRISWLLRSGKKTPNVICRVLPELVKSPAMFDSETLFANQKQDIIKMLRSAGVKLRHNPTGWDIARVLEEGAKEPDSAFSRRIRIYFPHGIKARVGKLRQLVLGRDTGNEVTAGDLKALGIAAKQCGFTVPTNAGIDWFEDVLKISQPLGQSGETHIAPEVGG